MLLAAPRCTAVHMCNSKVTTLLLILLCLMSFTNAGNMSPPATPPPRDVCFAAETIDCVHSPVVLDEISQDEWQEHAGHLVHYLNVRTGNCFQGTVVVVGDDDPDNLTYQVDYELPVRFCPAVLGENHMCSGPCPSTGTSSYCVESRAIEEPVSCVDIVEEHVVTGALLDHAAIDECSAVPYGVPITYTTCEAAGGTCHLATCGPGGVDTIQGATCETLTASDDPVTICVNTPCGKNESSSTESSDDEEEEEDGEGGRRHLTRRGQQQQHVRARISTARVPSTESDDNTSILLPLQPNTGIYEQIAAQCAAVPYEVRLVVESLHLYVLISPATTANDHKCPTIRAHAEFPQQEPYYHKMLSIVNDHHDDAQRWLTHQRALSLRIGDAFKLNELQAAHEAIDPAASSSGNYYHVLTYNCANYLLDLAAALHIRLDARILHFVATKLYQQQSFARVTGVNNNAVPSLVQQIRQSSLYQQIHQHWSIESSRKNPVRADEEPPPAVLQQQQQQQQQQRRRQLVSTMMPDLGQDIVQQDANNPKNRRHSNDAQADIEALVYARATNLF